MELSAIINIAQVRRRFGYRCIHDLLRPEFPKVNHKRVYRLYCAAKLAVRKRKGRSVTGWVIFALSVPLLPLLIVWMLASKKSK